MAEPPAVSDGCAGHPATAAGEGCALAAGPTEGESAAFCCMGVCNADDNGWDSVMEQTERGVGQAEDGPDRADLEAARSLGRTLDADASRTGEVREDGDEGPAGLFEEGRSRTGSIRRRSPTHLVSREVTHRQARGIGHSAHREAGPHYRLPSCREEPMVAHVDVDVASVWREYKASPSIEIRNQLVEHYLSLVKYNAERIWARLPDGVDLDDLISAGIFGLMDAIEAFDLERGVKFETYCVPRIRGAMLDELRTMDWVPRLVRSKASKMEEARKTLEAALGRPPRPDEMAEKLGVTLEDLYKMIGDATAVSQVSLNKKWYETDSYKDVREIDILEDKKAEDPTHRLQNGDLMRLVTRGLNRNERLIIILYYYEDMTMKEIGATLDLSESRVSQMHSSIVARLQSQLSQRRPEFST
jgi:RNA polymerase sigma factor for flagellar operon FliA